MAPQFYSEKTKPKPYQFRFLETRPATKTTVRYFLNEKNETNKQKNIANDSYLKRFTLMLRYKKNFFKKLQLTAMADVKYSFSTSKIRSSPGNCVFGSFELCIQFLKSSLICYIIRSITKPNFKPPAQVSPITQTITLM